MEMIFNELTISTGMEGRAAEARHVLDSTNRRDDIVLEGERGRFSLDEGRDRITVQVGITNCTELLISRDTQVYSVPLSYHYISSRLAGHPIIALSAVLLVLSAIKPVATRSRPS